MRDRRNQDRHIDCIAGHKDLAVCTELQGHQPRRLRLFGHSDRCIEHC